MTQKPIVLLGFLLDKKYPAAQVSGTTRCMETDGLYFLTTKLNMLPEPPMLIRNIGEHVRKQDWFPVSVEIVVVIVGFFKGLSICGL